MTDETKVNEWLKVIEIILNNARGAGGGGGPEIQAINVVVT